MFTKLCYEPFPLVVLAVVVSGCGSGSEPTDGGGIASPTRAG